MAIYAIGDVQGCFTELAALLSLIQFDSKQDTLWFTGDLVNRGPQSLQVLRFVKALGDQHKTVLGNHDLHLIARYYGAKSKQSDDTLDEILNAHDAKDLIDWLRHRPLLHDDKESGFVMTHAGLAPAWDLKTARKLAREVEHVLQGDTPEFFLRHMYGNQPDQWHDDLSGMDRLRCIINYFTRMRFCYLDGRLNLTYKGEMAGKPNDLVPWFHVKDRANANLKIIFGHWAALNGKTNEPLVYALDTGCVWGNCLTAMRLHDEKYFCIKCH